MSDSLETSYREAVKAQKAEWEASPPSVKSLQATVLELMEDVHAKSVANAKLQAYAEGLEARVTQLKEQQAKLMDGSGSGSGAGSGAGSDMSPPKKVKTTDGVDEGVTKPIPPPSACTLHRSGIPFPETLLERFQIDLAWQEGGWAAPWTNSWGPARPPMPRSVNKDSGVNRALLQTAALFWVEVGRVSEAVVKYAHHHHPDFPGEDGYGIDCSNFTSYLYNLVFGITFPSAITKQPDLSLPRIRSLDDLKPGDLAFFTRMKDTSAVNHVGVIVEVDGQFGVCHSTGAQHTLNHDGSRDYSGPQVTTKKSWWPLNRFSHGFSLDDLVTLNRPPPAMNRFKK